MSYSPPSLEDLVERRQPSALARQDAELCDAGAAPGEIAATRDALAALAVAGSSPRPPPSALRDRLVASRSRSGKYGIFADRIARLFDLTMPDAEALMTRLEEPSAWMPFLVDGLELIGVETGPKCAGAIATVVKLEPGTRFPEHAHNGEETMVVLDGGFHEPLPGGEEVWRGEEIFRDDGTEHHLVALPGVPCIAAVVIFGHADMR